MRLQSPVDLTSNMIMIEKSVLGETWTGDLNGAEVWRQFVELTSLAFLQYIFTLQFLRWSSFSSSNPTENYLQHCITVRVRYIGFQAQRIPSCCSGWSRTSRLHTWNTSPQPFDTASGSSPSVYDQDLNNIETTIYPRSIPLCFST